MADSSSSSPSRKRARLDGGPQAPPTAAEERQLFRLWLEASRLAAAAAVRKAAAAEGDKKEPEADRAARRAAHDAYLDRLAALGLDGKRGLVYDPLSRRFVDHAPGLDPRPSSRLYFQYYPAASNEQQPDSLPRKFELRVTNPNTKQRAPPCTVATLERHLPRRYRGARPGRVGVLRLSGVGEIGEVTCSVPGVDVRMYDLEGIGGAAFNAAFLRAVEGDGCEAVYLSRGAGDATAADSEPLVLTDIFFPTYPALLDGGRLLLLTPLQVYQVDGADSEARDAVQSLLDRASGVLGALVIERGARLPYMRYDRQRHQREHGLAHTRAAAAIEADSRALRITGRLRVGRYVPTFPHGWLSDDTAILLATALRVFRPRAVLELGAWLGLSSRFILKEGRASVRRFVTVDHYKNTAVGNAARLDDVAPLDKLYFRHLRYSTFYANIEQHCFRTSSSSSSDDASPQPPPSDSAIPPPEVVMLRANVHEAPQLMHAAGEPVDMVFIDAEKDAGRLRRLLETAQRLYPTAVIVGDDLAFAGVQQALVDAGVPDERLVWREEAYILLPAEGTGEGRDKAAVVSVMEGEVAPRLAVPAWQREVVALIGEGKDAEAVAVGAARGLGVGDVLYSPGKSILHDICRRRDEAALAFLDRYIEEELVGKALKAEEEEEAEGERKEKARIPVNDVGLTPFDYLTDTINF